MPLRLGTPVLQVDAGKMSQIDPRNVETLFGMWTVFHKCAESIEDGRRLENMSWRLWNRETFCCESKPQFSTKALDLITSKPSAKDIPELSSSVSSAGSVDAEGSCSRQASQEDVAGSRGKEKHITPQRLEQLVMHIKEKKVPEPISPLATANGSTITDHTPRPSSPTPQQDAPVESPVLRSNHSTDSQCSSQTIDSEVSGMPTDLAGSDTSVSSTAPIQSPTIVHGFSPSLKVTSCKSRSSLAAPSRHVAQTLAPPKSEPKKKETNFIIGNGSISEEESSFEDRLMLKPHPSSSSGHASQSSQPPKKQASFREILYSRPMDSEDAIESDDESVIDDEDDDSSWEDSEENESQTSSMDDKSLFQRVDSRPNLTSRRSLLTTALTQGDRAEALQRAAMTAQSSPNLRRSRRSSPNGPSMPTSPREEPAVVPARGPEKTEPKPIIVTTTNTVHPPAYSPRTTRRHMLSSELTQSLRQHLLWERQPRGGMANTAFKRSHTTMNMSNLKNQTNNQRPQGLETSKNNSWTNYFDFGPSEYHAKGW